MDASGRGFDHERQRAIDLALRALSARDRTTAELRTYLEGKRVEPDAIEIAVAELRGAGYIDDARYAERFAEDKRTLERWGAERIARDLRRRGVKPTLVDATLADRDAVDELQAAMDLLAERVPIPPTDDRARDRAWRMLVRRGYEPEIAYQAIRGYGRRAAA
jgi:regulatory protein